VKVLTPPSSKVHDIDFPFEVQGLTIDPKTDVSFSSVPSAFMTKVKVVFPVIGTNRLPTQVPSKILGF
jgi:hypothetical protein